MYSVLGRQNNHGLTVIPPIGLWGKPKKETKRVIMGYIADLAHTKQIKAKKRFELHNSHLTDETIALASSNYCPQTYWYEVIPLRHRLLLHKFKRRYLFFRKEERRRKTYAGTFDKIIFNGLQFGAR